MPYAPQYGGTNGVAELDIGQPGSPRSGVSALATVSVIQGGEQATTVDDAVPQQNIVFEQNLGFSGGIVVWQGSLRIDTPATLQAIFADLASYRHGSLRSGGTLAAPDPSLIKPTRLTDAFGNVISDRARLQQPSMTSRIRRITGNATYGYHVGIRIVFGLLG